MQWTGQNPHSHTPVLLGGVGKSVLRFSFYFLLSYSDLIGNE